MLAPTTCHRFVGYLEEEAVHTYTLVLKAIDDGKLPQWSITRAPQDAIDYYELPETATMRDVILHIRADEACHRSVNHHFSDIPSFYEVDNHAVKMSEKGLAGLPEEELKQIG